MSKLETLVAMAAGIVVAASSQAAVVNLHHAELIKNDGTVNASEEWPAAGSFNGTFNANGGYVFQLPATPVGQQIDSIIFDAGASLTWYVPCQIVSDLYGARVSDTPAFTGADYDSGSAQQGVKLTTGWFTGTAGTLATVDITDFVLDAGFTGGQYVLLRTGSSLEEAQITASAQRWWTDSKVAKLDITYSPVPEPTMIGLIGLSGLFLFRRQRVA